MRLKTVNTIMWIACLVMVGILASSVVASSLCNCKGTAPASVPDQNEQVRGLPEQVKQIYVHTNSLVHHIEERNQGKAFETWSPGDQTMYTTRTRELADLIANYPRLARDPAARTIIHYHATPDRE